MIRQVIIYTIIIFNNKINKEGGEVKQAKKELLLTKMTRKYASSKFLQLSFIESEY